MVDAPGDNRNRAGGPYFFAPSERHSERQSAMRQEQKNRSVFPLRFWLYAAAVLLYGIAETLSGNWSGPYLTGERGISAQGASYGAHRFLGDGNGRANFIRRPIREDRGTLDLCWSAHFVGRGISGSLARLIVKPAALWPSVSPGLGCSAFFPLCISLSGQEFPRLAAAMSGGMVAFYQAGYGVAAFGVGPLRDFTGLSFRAIFSFGSLVAGLILVVALAVAFRPSLASTHPKIKAA